MSGLIAATALGQSALDGFDPNANGTIRTIVVQPDGKILLGGDFTTLAPNGSSVVTRNYIARLNPDGTLDSAFDPNANSPVQTIVLQGDGKILVGGAFTTIGRQHRTRLARLNSDSGLADSFDAHADPSVTPAILAIAVQPDGKILVGGVFSGPNCIGGQTRNYLARLDSTTGLADSFDPNPNGYVTSIVLQPDRKILVAGEFKGTNSIGGQARNYLARIDATTGLADSFNPNPNGEVYAIAIQPDGKVVTGGAFHTIGGQARSCIARLDSTTGFADFFNPSANDAIISVAIQADGKILAVGAFHGANSIGGKTRNGIARIDPVTGAIDSFDPNAGVVAPTLAVAVQTNGKILVGGNFTALAPNGGTTVARNRIARLETNGRLDQTLNPSVLGEFVAALAVQPDGKIIIGGKFTTVLGVARNSIARLNADGTLDLAFNPNANDWVLSIALQPDGKVLASGRFSSIGGQLRNRIARLDAVTGAADSFDPNANDVVYSVAMQPDGKVLAGGLFTTIGGLSRNRIARLDPATGSADAFDPNANQIVFSIVVQADGKILVGGVFNHIGGQARNLIARLDPTTSAADSFDPNANNYVQTIALQPDGKILVGGQFTNIGGQMRNHIARLDPWTGVADSFNPNATYSVYSIAVQADGKILTGGEFESIGGQPRHNIARLDASGLADSFDPSASQIVNAVAVQPDGKVVAGGYFQSIGGQSRNLLARLSNDTAAVQELTAAERSIVWRRGGSSPQFTRVEFEFSTDNINYSFLGDGVSVGANWVLRGPWRLPIGENFFVRARGHYVTGFFNGSESMAESVRSVFLITDETGPPPVPFPTATATASPMPTPTATATPTATPTAAATVTPAAEATATATATPSPTATATATPTATLTATVAPTRMVTPFPSRTPAPGSILGNVFSRLLVGTGDDVRTTLPQSDRRFRPPFGGQ